jgi:outer membrane immunogenic protein
MVTTQLKALSLAAAVAVTGATAQAADLPVKYKAPIVAAVYDWTGFYIGVNAGIGLGRDLTSVSVAPGFLTEVHRPMPFGGLGGGQIGYNWQVGRFGSSSLVVGVEADIQATDLTDDRICVINVFCPSTSASTLSQKLGWFGTARGRVGIADGPVLSYFTGGFAYGRVETLFSNLPGGVPVSYNENRSGYAIGSGVEAALGGGWTGKLEYLYVDLGSQTGLGPIAVLPASSFSSDIREHIVRAGLNYRIGGSTYAPAPAANWAGFYLGGNFGSVAATNATTIFNPPGLPALPVPARLWLSPSGYVGGVQAGYNWQAANWVFGVEADIQGSNQRDNKICIITCTPVIQSVTFDQKMGWLGTVRGRLGYSVGPTLFYVTGGAAFGDVKTTITTIAGPFVTVDTVSATRTGYTVGGGIESGLELFGLLGKGWTTKTEYLFVDLGRSDWALPNSGFEFSTRVQEHIFRTGVNYHFNQPVVAKY